MTAAALAGYEDLPAAVRAAPRRAVPSNLGDAGSRLGVPQWRVSGLRVESDRLDAGLRRRVLTWHLGAGPRTRAHLVTPAGAEAPLPGMLLLHCHGGVRSVGADQLTAGGRLSAARLRRAVYEGRAAADDAARHGFAVLAHDTFSWGSRAFALTSAPRGSGLAERAEAVRALAAARGVELDDDAVFDAVASDHEHTIAKLALLLDTSLAGLVAADDLAALDVLAGLADVDDGRLAAAGVSGGGGRALLLGALDTRIRRRVVVCMMTTRDALVPDHVDDHSWLLHAPGVSLPALAEAGAGELLVQYGERDALFSPRGQRDAHELLTAAMPRRYTGRWYPGGHVWSGRMQDDAWAWAAAAGWGNRLPPAGGRTSTIVDSGS